jgi:hypothetical protein
VHVTAPAGRLVGAAARLLPAPYRARYGEEYRSELWELAAAGGGRSQQIRYALHQVSRVVSLRFELRTPRRRKASS